MNNEDFCPAPLEQDAASSAVPPQVVISDHSVGQEIPLVSSDNPLLTLLSVGGGSCVPITTPPSVFPPTPPSVPPSPRFGHSPDLPRVFVSDHSEGSSSSVEVRMSSQISDPKEDSGGGMENDPIFQPPLPRSSSEPSLLLLHSDRTEFSGEVAEDRYTHSRGTSHRNGHRQRSSPPRTNSWMKKLLVCGISILVASLVVRIGVELWKAAYGEELSYAHK